MRLLHVAYGAQETYLRDWHEDGKWLKGIACNEFGVANREGCTDAELWIAIRRIERTDLVEAMRRLSA